jgi:crossover junction endodeoxyribonuclease RuvC
MVILGVDPGSRATGYGLITAEGRGFRHLSSGVIRPPAGKSLAERLMAIDAEVRALLTAAQPHEVAIEGLFHARSPRTAIVLGHARGIVLLAARSGGSAVAEYAPRAVKLAVTGSGRASKAQVRAMVTRLIAEAPAELPLDAADALAVALCHGYRRSDPRTLIADRPRTWSAYVAQVEGSGKRRPSKRPAKAGAGA